MIKNSSTCEFHLITDAGELSATLIEADQAVCSLLLAHGAGADHKHAHMQALAHAFASVGISILRFNFPFKQQGRNRVDSKEVSIRCIEEAAEVLRSKISLQCLLEATVLVVGWQLMLQ